MQEKHIERTLTLEVKKAGGICFKFISPGTAGVPDRLILFPGGRAFFAETKAPGKKLRPLQVKRKRQIEMLEFKVYVIDSLEGIERLIEEVGR